MQPCVTQALFYCWIVLIIGDSNIFSYNPRFPLLFRLHCFNRLLSRVCKILLVFELNSKCSRLSLIKVCYFNLLFSGRYEQTSSTKSYMYYVEMYEGKKIPVTEWTIVPGEFQLSLFWVQGNMSNI